MRRGQIRLPLLMALALPACPKQQERTTPPPPPPRADLVLVGGSVVSEAHPNATAIAVDDGVIVDIGTDAALESWIGDETQVVGLVGRTVLPGLQDAHMHLAGLGKRRFGIDLVGTGTLEAVQKKVAAAVEKATPRSWIRGRGWDQNDWEDFVKRRKKFPMARDLDAVAPNHPVVLTRVDGHAIWVNSKAMEIAGITRRTRRVKGGQIIKHRGRPSGIFIDNAMQLIRDHVPELAGEQLDQALELAHDECLAAGLTQIHDMGVSKGVLHALKTMDVEGRLKLRVYAMHDGSVEDLPAVLEGGPFTAQGKRRLTVRGVKLMIDGALGSRGAALIDPYSDDRRNRGQLLLSEEDLEARVRAAHSRGFQVATHAIGDKANRVVLNVYERVFGSDAWKHRPRIEHAQVVDPEDIGRFGKSGVIASVQPIHATSDMPWAEARIGKKRIEGAYAWQSLLTTNATVAAGSDAPVEDVSPVLGLYAAITRKDLFGSPENGWFPDQRFKPTQALAAFTTGAAWASFTEDTTGVIDKGRPADLTVVTDNPLTAAEDKLASTQVMITIIGGEIVYAKPGATDAPPPPVKTSTTSTTAG